MRIYSFNVQTQGHTYEVTVQAKNRYQAAGDMSVPLNAIPTQRLPDASSRKPKPQQSSKHTNA
jgi:hypothetical protein